MQINEYDMRKIREEIKQLGEMIKEIEKGVEELKQDIVSYKEKYGEQPISEWIESLDASKNVDVEE